jgi:uncharacterized protein (TIGR00730 family)
MIKKHTQHGQTRKAYKNLKFLNSPNARLVRILSEYLEPQARFRNDGVRDTIVFFGSARVTPRRKAIERLKEAEALVSKARRPTKKLLQALRDAQMRVEMSRYYEDTVELARLLTMWAKKLDSSQRFVVCSGGGPGIMEAANKGAYLAKGKSIGLNISLPFEQKANRYVSEGLGFEFHYFFMRKFWFAYLAKALVVFPGGFGTMDELMEILTLLQTQKIKKKMAVVVYGTEYWNKVLNLDEMLRYGVITKKDLSLFKFMDSPKEAFQYLKGTLMKNYPPEH